MFREEIWAYSRGIDFIGRLTCLVVGSDHPLHVITLKISSTVLGYRDNTLQDTTYRKSPFLTNPAFLGSDGKLASCNVGFKIYAFREVGGSTFQWTLEESSRTVSITRFYSISFSVTCGPNHIFRFAPLHSVHQIIVALRVPLNGLVFHLQTHGYGRHILFWTCPGLGMNTVVSLQLPIPRGWILQLECLFSFVILLCIVSRLTVRLYETRFLYFLFEVFPPQGPQIAKKCYCALISTSR